MRPAARALLVVVRNLRRSHGPPRCSFSSSSSASRSSSDCRLLLRATRELAAKETHSTNDDRRRLFLRCFPLRASQVVEDPPFETPSDFHRLLCQRIRRAKRRVQLASLYVGTASSKLDNNTELELLQALRHAVASTSNTVQIQILLDASRALRPVPTAQKITNENTKPNNRTTAETKTTITSAQACFEAIVSDNESHEDDTYNGNNDNKRSGGNNGVYLLSVLPPLLQRLLPNPLNEISGVFHLKAYLVDDEVILSGANLSHEYFTTRIDRYLHIRDNPELVTFYSTFIDLLCRYGALRYSPADSSASFSSLNQSGGTSANSTLRMAATTVNSIHQRKKLQESLERLFTTTEEEIDVKAGSDGDDEEIVAYAVPTFHAPSHYFPSPSVLDHEQTLRNLLQAASDLRGASSNPNKMTDNKQEDEGSVLSSSSTSNSQSHYSLTARIATAYLNPTLAFLQALASSCCETHFLTAGRVSHGFAPKNKDNNNNHAPIENHSRDMTIPHVFMHAAQQAAKQLCRLQQQQHKPKKEVVSFYQRPGWTFHAKGLWLALEEDAPTTTTTTTASNNNAPSTTTSSLKLSTSSSSSCRLLAVTHGSGNFGERSAGRDMESNLILILASSSSPSSSSLSTRTDSPPHSRLARKHVEEWNRLCDYANNQGQPEELPPPLWIRFIYPWIRSFF